MTTILSFILFSMIILFLIIIGWIEIGKFYRCPDRYIIKTPEKKTKLLILFVKNINKNNEKTNRIINNESDSECVYSGD